MLVVGEHAMGDMDARFIRMMTGFGGGIAGSHEELCGAFTAGVAVIGVVHGRSEPGHDDSRAYELCGLFRQRFRDRWGTLTCGPIRDWAKGPDGTGDCSAVVQETVKILLDLLGESRA